MARGDITILEQSSDRGRGCRQYSVTAQNTIYAGEPVARALAGVSVTPCANNAGIVATDYIVGVAMTDSAAFDGKTLNQVEVLPLTSETTYLIAPKVAATWDTQAEYDALVGKRVLIDLNSGSYTLLAADGATYGCIVQPLDIRKYPGKVAFAFREGCSDLS